MHLYTVGLFVILLAAFYHVVTLMSMGTHHPAYEMY